MQCKCRKYNDVNIYLVRTNEILRMWFVKMFSNNRINRKYEVDRGKSIFILPRVVIQMQIFTCRIEYGGLFWIFFMRKSTFAYTMSSRSFIIFFPSVRKYTYTQSTWTYFRDTYIIINGIYMIRIGEKSISNVKFSNPIGEWPWSSKKFIFFARLPWR